MKLFSAGIVGLLLCTAGCGDPATSDSTGSGGATDSLTDGGTSPTAGTADAADSTSMGGSGSAGTDASSTGPGGDACIPVGDAVVGEGPPPRTGATMNWFIQDAFTHATAWQPDAELIEVVGNDLMDDGTIDLSVVTTMVGWDLLFESDGALAGYSIKYSGTQKADYPILVETGHFDYPPIDPDALVDSDVLAAQYLATEGCGALTGTQNQLRIGGNVGVIGYVLGNQTVGVTWLADQIECFMVSENACVGAR